MSGNLSYDTPEVIFETDGSQNLINEGIISDNGAFGDLSRWEN